MRVHRANNVSVYVLHSDLPLIQDFAFPEASNTLKYTQDGDYIVSTGVYKPHIRTYQLRDLSMKFDRYTDAETINFEVLF